MTYYYLADTYLGILPIKSTVPLENKAQVKALINGSVSWFSPSTRISYYYWKIKRVFKNRS